ncbi:T9SS type A sorting domain-containing protein [Dyadobacter sp. LHD-138]|uniref:T9SS type A sorting domain-containing protein n=1 Tax=Dyadobacter sp. LHD-138 TaxID=3071413 RepID=UPI0027E09B8B|nr:T9SS type A sorting domain-containing protein [Dyadobacter sp. LHD-138]MDQ6476730.1 T9SS type A sorting domain-containing protein [Dyadobacter sp. LHD-138]
MKKTVLYLIICTFFAWTGIQAQTVANGSRLNLTPKKKSIPAGDLKFSNVPAVLNYKPLSLQKPMALNNFYRTLLFSNTSATESTAVIQSEPVEKTVEKRNPVAESSVRTEEQLYSNDKITVSNIYPNPASEYAEVDYAMSSEIRDAKLIFYNVLGSQMQEYSLSKNESKLRINTREMSTGLYFYQLALDGKKVATKKMLVRHQQ